MRRGALLCTSLFATTLLVGCGGNDGPPGGPDGGVDVADTSVGSDAADASDAPDYGPTAKHVPPALAYDFGGPVLDAPNVVPVFFGGDPQEATLEAFLTKLAASTYWPAVT